MRPLLMLALLAAVSPSAWAADPVAGSEAPGKGDMCRRQASMSMSMGLVMDPVDPEAAPEGDVVQKMLAATMGSAPLTFEASDDQTTLMRVIRPPRGDRKPGRYEVVFERRQAQQPMGEPTVDPLQGRTFDVDVAKGKVKESGAGPVDEETTARVLGAVGNPSEACGSLDFQGAQLIPGTQVNMPMPIGDLADRAEVQATVARLGTEGGRETAFIDVAATADAPAGQGVTMRLTVEGTLVVDVDTGRTTGIDLTGTVALDTGAMPALGGVSLQADGPLTMHIATAWYDRAGRKLYDRTGE